MLKKGQKLRKIENVVTYSSFSLLQGYPQKIHINTFIAIIRSTSAQKFGLSDLLFCQLLETNILGGDKNTSFLMRYQLLEREMVSIAVFKYFYC